MPSARSWHLLLNFRWLLLVLVVDVELPDGIILQLDDYLIAAVLLLWRWGFVLISINSFRLLRPDGLLPITTGETAAGWTPPRPQSSPTANLAGDVRVLVGWPASITSFGDGAMYTLGIAALNADLVAAAKVTMQT